MNEALITLENVSIGYNGHTVLSGISLEIAEGSYTAILGANGSGKSTLVKTLLGIIPPTGGAVRFASSAAPPLFGYVPQAMELDPIYLLTGFEVAVMGSYGRIRPGRPVIAAERAFTRQCLAATGAEPFAHKRFAELSGGQKQRILIARALVARPDVLVLDEPTAGVDGVTTRAVLAFVARLHEEKHITVLLVTHDLAPVHQHVEHVIRLREGEVLHGPATEMLRPDRMAESFGPEIG